MFYKYYSCIFVEHQSANRLLVCALNLCSFLFIVEHIVSIRQWYYLAVLSIIQLVSTCRHNVVHFLNCGTFAVTGDEIIYKNALKTAQNWMLSEQKALIMMSLKEQRPWGIMGSNHNIASCYCFLCLNANTCHWYEI